MHVIQVDYKWLGEHSNMVNYKNINNKKKKKYPPKTYFKTMLNGKSPNQRPSAKNMISTLCSVHFPMYYIQIQKYAPWAK